MGAGGAYMPPCQNLRLRIRIFGLLTFTSTQLRNFWDMLELNWCNLCEMTAGFMRYSKFSHYDLSFRWRFAIFSKNPQNSIGFNFFIFLTFWLDFFLATNIFTLGLVKKKKPKSILILNIQGEHIWPPDLHHLFVFKGPNQKGFKS